MLITFANGAVGPPVFWSRFYPCVLFILLVPLSKSDSNVESIERCVAQGIKRALDQAEAMAQSNSLEDVGQSFGDGTGHD